MPAKAKISARALKAFDILKDGGQFVRRLERNYRFGHEQWVTHLLNAQRSKVRGIGFATYCDLEFYLVTAGGGTSVSSYYKLREGAELPSPVDAMPANNADLESERAGRAALSHNPEAFDEMIRQDLEGRSQTALKPQSMVSKVQRKSRKKLSK